MKTRNKTILIISIAIVILAVISTGIVITITNSSSDDVLHPDNTVQNSESYDIPIHVYDIWQSNGMIIHGDVENPQEGNKRPVSILVTDQKGALIEASQVMPDDSGRFLIGISKTSSTWDAIKEYNVTASYTSPVVSKNEIPKDILLDKDTIPLTPKQISKLSHNQIIKVIKEWNHIGGNSPFTVISLIGMKETYHLGDPIEFFIQKSGYGNPCHDQGVVVFDDMKKIRVATAFYLEMCNSEENILEPFNYLIPYNFGIFPKLAPITEPGDYIMVAGATESEKQKHKFTVLESDYIHDYKIVYKMQKDSSENIQTMTIDMNSDSILIEYPDGTTKKSPIDSETIQRIDAEIKENYLIVNPMTNHSYGESCDACRFGMMQIYVGDVLVHYLLFDDNALSVTERQIRGDLSGESPYFFSLVDCVSSKNGFDTYWITDSGLTNKNSYSEEKCSEIGINADTRIKSSDRYGQADYEMLVNDKSIGSVPEETGSVGSTHVHASILVKIFGDKFDFSGPAYQIKNAYIHFEGQDGDTIHMHATGVPIEFLFKTMNIGITDDCFILPDGREFCTNDENSLEFYVNEKHVDSIINHVISQNDRILVSYGSYTVEQIKKEITELESQMIIE